MTSSPVVVEMEWRGRPREIREYGRPAKSLYADLLRDLQSDGDGMLTLRPKDRDDHMMIAISGAKAFLGLDTRDGLFQFEGSPHAAGTTEMVIGGEATFIDSRYVVDFETARACIEEWLSNDEQPPDQRWHRQ